MNKKRIYFSPFITLLLIIGLAILFVRPRIIEINEIQNNLKVERERLVKLTEKAAFLQNQDLNKLKNDANLVNSAIPSEKDIPYILSSLNLLSREASVSVISVQTSPGKISTESGVKSLAKTIDQKSSSQTDKLLFNVVIEGPFEGIKYFLTKLASILPLQSVNSISFSRKGKGEEVFGTVNATFSIATYYQLLPKYLGKTSDPIEKITPEEEKILSTISTFEKAQEVTGSVPVGREDPFSPL